MTTISLPAVPIDGGLSNYFREAWSFPVLEAEEELHLATQWRDHGDKEAAHKLVTSHLRLVAKIAMKYKGYGLPMADLVSEGNIGLMQAVKRFEPERGFRLSTYAMWWIRASITEYILKSWSLVKIGSMAAQKKLFFSLRRLKGQLKIVDSGELRPDQAKQLSDMTGVSAPEIIHVNRRLASRDTSLNVPIGEDETQELQDTLVAEAPSPEAIVAGNQETNHRRGLLMNAMADLDDRERHILTERRLKDDPQTLEELGAHYGISRERVRQLENRAFNKVQKALTAPTIDD